MSSGVKIITKPQALHVPAWQMVSALVEKPLRTATWWTYPSILSSEAGEPGCWSSSMNGNPEEVQIAMSGQWQGTKFNLTGGLGTDYNHAKLGHSLNGSLAIMGDMNQQGSYSPSLRSCSSSQNGRGGMFFVVDDVTLHAGLKEMMTGETAEYYGPSPSPGSSSTPGPSPSPDDTCGGAGVRSSSCESSANAAAGCVYVYSANAETCGVSEWGCYLQSSLPSACPEKQALIIL